MIDEARRQSLRVARGLARRGRDGAVRARRSARIAGAVLRDGGPGDALPLARRAAHLLGPRRFGLEEAYTLGLLDPRVPDDLVDASVSKRELIALQARLNPNEFWYLTEDKAVFYRLAEAVGVRVPALLAVLCETGPGWSATGEPLARADDWERLFAEGLPDTFVVKPARGYHGLDVRVIERRDGLLHQLGGEAITPAQLARDLVADRRFHIHVVQERITNAPEVPGARSAVQTARISTLVERDGTVRPLNAFFRSALEGNVIDNFRHGTTGNLVAPLDPASGTVLGLTAVGDDGVLREVDPPPGTGAPAPGTRLPMWDECLALVRSAAPHFLPMRTLGWDVAVTPQGPTIVEANMWWDPVGSVHGVRAALDALRAA